MHIQYFPDVPCLDSAALMSAWSALERRLGLKAGQRLFFEDLVHLCPSPDTPPTCHDDRLFECFPAVSRLSLPAEQRTRKGCIICILHTRESPCTKVISAQSALAVVVPKARISLYLYINHLFVCINLLEPYFASRWCPGRRPILALIQRIHTLKCMKIDFLEPPSRGQSRNCSFWHFSATCLINP